MVFLRKRTFLPRFDSLFLSFILTKLKIEIGLNYVNWSLILWLQVEKCRKLVKFAEKCLEEDTDVHYGIEACNEVLEGHGHEIGTKLMHECLCIRAVLLLKVF